MPSSIISPKKPARNQTRVSKCVMTHVQLVLAIYGAVCVGATLGYVIAHQLIDSTQALSPVASAYGRIGQ